MRVTSGVDIIDIVQISATISDPAQLQRMLHPSDTTRSDQQHIAGRIALKEAAIKALGLQPGDWLKIYIHTQARGKPVLHIDGLEKQPESIDGSISHHGNMAIGFVVALFNDEKG